MAVHSHGRSCGKWVSRPRLSGHFSVSAGLAVIGPDEPPAGPGPLCPAADGHRQRPAVRALSQGKGIC